MNENTEQTSPTETKPSFPTPVASPTHDFTPPVGPAPKKGGSMTIVVVVVVGAIFAAGGYFLGSAKKSPQSATPATVKQTAATPVASTTTVYKLATNATTVSTAPAVSIKMPQTWMIEPKAAVPSVMASGPANHSESKLVPSIEASAAKAKNGTLAAEVAAFKKANAVDADMLISEKTSTAAGQPATTIEFSMPDPDDTKSGAPVIMHMMAKLSVKNGVLYQVVLCGDDRDWFSLIGMYEESLASFTY